MTLPGVDVASFQGLPAQWQPVAGAIDWAAVKITELQPSGFRYVNPDAAADWAALKAAGRLRIGYLFGHPATSVTGTVALFNAQIRALGLDDRDGIALDLEVTDGRGAAQVSAWAVQVTEALASHLDRTPLVYTFLNFAAAGNCAGLGRYPLWIADPSSPKGQPRVPKPWTQWAIHQHVTGGTIDRDAANWPTRDAMAAAIGRHQPKPPPVRRIVTHVTAGHLSLHDLAAKHKTTAPHILHLTCDHFGGFPPEVAGWVSDLFAGVIDAQADVPAGLHLRVPVVP
jgi:lysozyme